MGLLDFFTGAETGDIPEVRGINPSQVSQQGLDIRQRAFPQITNMRESFDKQFLELDQTQFERADSFKRNRIEDDIIPSLSRQREQLSDRDVNQLRKLSDVFGGTENLTRILQGQAESDLKLGGDLSAQDIRANEQQVGSATGRRGRGAGAFAVGQTALGRDQMRRQREAERRNFAGSAARLGLDVSQPIQDIIGRNAQIVGTPAQAFQQSDLFARASRTPDIPIFDQTLSGFEAQRFGIESAAREKALDRKAAATSDAMGGLGGLLSKLLGGMGGGGKGGKGGKGGGKGGSKGGAGGAGGDLSFNNQSGVQLTGASDSIDFQDLDFSNINDGSLQYGTADGATDFSGTDLSFDNSFDGVDTFDTGYDFGGDITMDDLGSGSSFSNQGGSSYNNIDTGSDWWGW